MNAQEYRERAEKLLTRSPYSGPDVRTIQQADVWARLAVSASISEAAEQADEQGAGLMAALAQVALSHFHCPKCHPVLTRGQTPAVCGAVIPPPIVGSGPERRCPDCRRQLPSHKASHRKGF